MKNSIFNNLRLYYTLKSIIIIVSVLSFTSCDNNLKDDDTIAKNESSNFNESVAIIQNGLKVSNEKSSRVTALKIEIISFNSDFILKRQYDIEGIQYTDDGLFNDEIEGDGIYTSVKVFQDLDSIFDPNSLITNYSDEFMFTNELNTYLNNKMINEKGGGKLKAKIGCKIRTAPCPETDWWNTCWPLSSPCTCVEFYDCEASVELEVEL